MTFAQGGWVDFQIAHEVQYMKKFGQSLRECKKGGEEYRHQTSFAKVSQVKKRTDRLTCPDPGRPADDGAALAARHALVPRRVHVRPVGVGVEGPQPERVVVRQDLAEGAGARARDDLAPVRPPRDLGRGDAVRRAVQDAACGKSGINGFS